MEIILKSVKASEKIFNFLEKKGLISTFKPTKSALTTKKKTGMVDVLYTSRSTYGSHRLMCIGKKNIKVQMCYHLDNEDIFLINPQNIKYAPLYFIFALDKIKLFNTKLKKGLLTSKDFVAVECEFNNPALSFFSVLKGTVHCEVTKKCECCHPVFLVSEGSKLKNNKIKHKDIKIFVDGE